MDMGTGQVVSTDNPDEIPEYAEILRRAADAPRNFPIPRKVSRKNLEQAFLTSFELIGGLPRLALWADANPTEFYRLITKLFPQHVQGKLGVDESLAAILSSMGSRPQAKPIDISDAEVISSGSLEGSTPVPSAIDTMVHTRALEKDKS